MSATMPLMTVAHIEAGTPPTCTACVMISDTPSARLVGADVVADVSGGLVHLLVPIASGAGRVGFRLSFDREQLGALMDELCGCAELLGEGGPW